MKSPVVSLFLHAQTEQFGDGELQVYQHGEEASMQRASQLTLLKCVMVYCMTAIVTTKQSPSRMTLRDTLSNMQTKTCSPPISPKLG